MQELRVMMMMAQRVEGGGRKMRTVTIIDGHLTADEQLATVLYARLAATLQGSGAMCPIYISYS